MRESATTALDPRLLQLLRLQFRGRIRRSWKRMASRRRLIPTLLVAGFLVLYVIQIYIAIALNPSQATIDIGGVAPLGMFLILTIKLLGICIDRNKSGAGYRDEEVHYLLGGPFAQPQVRLYRVFGHAISIFFTSVFAAIFFRFHVASFPAALVGAYLAMLFTYLLYSWVAVVAVNVREPVYQRGRVLACLAGLGLLGYCVFRVSQRQVSNVEFLRGVWDEAVLLTHTPAGWVLTSPFQAFTRIVVADNLRESLPWIAVGLLLVLFAIQQLLYWEVTLERWARSREQREFASGCHQQTTHACRAPSDRALTRPRQIPWLGGSGPIVWRQLKAVVRLRSGLSWLLLPLGGALALGCYAAYDPQEGAFMTIAVTVVLSSVFLPGLLPFDFRGDLAGLSALKMMPIRPFSVVLGQLTMPVLLLGLFQLTALSMLILHDRSLWSTILLTMCFLVPTNTIILALENLIFLLYPYRMAEFDMQATVRRIVMLMAKFCVVFLSALISLAAGFGLLGLRRLFQQIGVWTEALAVVHGPVLIFSQLAILSCVAWLMVLAACWAYRRFDLGEDLPL